MRTNTNDYNICIPMSYNKHMERGFENQDSALQGLRICSLDPGVRTFQTVFDAFSSNVIQVGDADMGRIFRLGLEVDKLVAKITTCSSSRQKYRNDVHCQ